MRRRHEILDRLGLTQDELKKISSTRTLTPEEYDAREELDQIAFLLGE